MNDGSASFISTMIETPITDVLQALGDPARLEIVRGLLDGQPRACGTFELGLSPSTLTHHYNVLRAAGLIETKIDGRRRLNRLRRRELDEAYPGLLEAVLAGR
jgi:DNA-binding transcriptional ArsR family regulator